MRLTPFFIAALAVSAPVVKAQSGPPPEAKVTFSTPGGRASTVIAALGKAAGIPLETTAAIAEDVLTLRVRDGSLRSVMDKIAVVTGGSWKPSGAGFILFRNSDMIRAQQREEQAIRNKRVSDAIRKLVEADSARKPFEKSDAERIAAALPDGMMTGPRNFTMASVQAGPGAWVVSQLLAIIDPTSLSMEPGQRVVFSTQANRMQKVLPGKSQGILREFIRRQQMFSDAAKKRSTNPDRQVSINGMSPTMGPGDPSLGLGKTLLGVRSDSRGGLNAQLTVLDSRGALIANASMYLDTTPETPNTMTRSGDGAPLTLSGLAKEFASLLPKGGAGGGRMMVMEVSTVSSGGGAGSEPVEASIDMVGGGGGQKSAGPALRALLLKPEKVDPTGITAGQALVDAADQEDKTLVAQLPDSSVVPAMRRLLNGISAVEYLSFLDRRQDVVVAEEGSSWTIHPELPATARRQRISRVGLGDLLRSIASKGSLRLLDIGAFAARQAKPLDVEDLDGLMAASLDANVGADDLRQLSFQNWNTLRIYGLLGSGQRQALLNGTALSLAQMTAQQRDLIAEDYYGQPSGMVFMGGGVNVQVNETRGGRPGPAPSPLDSEPTELLPDGIPGSGTLQVKFQEQPAVRAKDSATGLTRMLSVGSLAMMNRLSSAGGLSTADFKKPNYDRFQSASQARYSFTFTLGPKSVIRRSLTDSGVDQGAEFGSWDQLPAATRKKYDELMKQLQNAGSALDTKGAIPPR